MLRGDGVIAVDVAPVLQAYVPPPEAVSVTLPPEQNVVAPVGVMAAVGSGLAVTSCAADAEQPLAPVTVTVYVAEEPTVMLAAVDPVVHEYETPPEAVRPTVAGTQKVVAPEGVITAVGTAGVKDPARGAETSKESHGMVPLYEKILYDTNCPHEDAGKTSVKVLAPDVEVTTMAATVLLPMVLPTT